MANFKNSTPHSALVDAETLAWIEQDCEVDISMKEEVEASTVATPRDAEDACEETGVIYELAVEHCATILDAAKALCELQFCSDSANANTVIAMAAADSEITCQTSFLASQVCTPYVDYRFYGCPRCKLGQTTEKSSWSKCMNDCYSTSGCKQAVYDLSSKECKMYSCVSFEDADGTPGMSLNYVSAVCYMNTTMADLATAAAEGKENRLEPPVGDNVEEMAATLR